MKKIPILDLKAQIDPIRGRIDQAIKEVVDSSGFILGKAVDDFEKAVVDYCGVKFAVACSNGTDAIRLALEALGVRRGDGVICPAFTFYATAGAVASMCARPVFADIDPDTYNISVDGLEKALKKTHGVKAIIPVHLYGQSADMDAVNAVARRKDLVVIEDNAQAFGAEYKGKKTGNFGDCASISFFPGKNLGAFGDAGMVICRDAKTAENIKVLRNQGNKERYKHLVIGHNNRMDTIQAAILKVKLKYLDAWNDKRRDNAGYYNTRLAGLGIKTPFETACARHIYHHYVIRVQNGSARLMKHLNDAGIDARVYYPIPLHLQPCFGYLGYKAGDFPESERASREILSIPVYPELTRENMDYIIDSIKGYLQG